MAPNGCAGGTGCALGRSRGVRAFDRAPRAAGPHCADRQLAGFDSAAVGSGTGRRAFVAGRRRTLGLAPHCRGDVGHRAWPRSCTRYGRMRVRYRLLPIRCFLAFYPLVFAGLLLLIRQRLRYVPPGDPHRCGGGRAHRRRRGNRADIGTYRTGDHRLAGRRAHRTRLPGGRSYCSLALTAGSLAILGWRTEPTLGAARRRARVVCRREHDLSVRAAARLVCRKGHWIDACWPGAFLLIAAAAWVSGTHPACDRRRDGHRCFCRWCARSSLSA